MANANTVTLPDYIITIRQESIDEIREALEEVGGTIMGAKVDVVRESRTPTPAARTAKADVAFQAMLSNLVATAPNHGRQSRRA